jgi:hypothetical protein
MGYLLTLFSACTAGALEPGTKMTEYAHKAWRFGEAGVLGTPQSITQTQDGYMRVSITCEVQIDYTRLSFRIPEEVHFRYQLYGYDAT